MCFCPNYFLPKAPAKVLLNFLMRKSLVIFWLFLSDYAHSYIAMLWVIRYLRFTISVHLVVYGLYNMVEILLRIEFS